MPRGDESSPGSKRLEKEMHEQFLEPQEAGMLKTGLVSGYRWEFTFCQEKTVTLLTPAWSCLQCFCRTFTGNCQGKGPITYPSDKVIPLRAGVCLGKMVLCKVRKVSKAWGCRVSEAQSSSEKKYLSHVQWVEDTHIELSHSLFEVILGCMRHSLQNKWY